MTASISMKVRPWPDPKRASPTMIIMSPMGAAEPVASTSDTRYLGSSLRRNTRTNSRSPLNQQRNDNRNGNVPLGVFGFAAHGGHRFESDQDQNGDRGLNEHPAKIVNADDRFRIGMAWNPGGLLVSYEIVDVKVRAFRPHPASAAEPCWHRGRWCRLLCR